MNYICFYFLVFNLTLKFLIDILSTFINHSTHQPSSLHRLCFFLSLIMFCFTWNLHLEFSIIIVINWYLIWGSTSFFIKVNYKKIIHIRWWTRNCHIAFFVWSLFSYLILPFSFHTRVIRHNTKKVFLLDFQFFKSLITFVCLNHSNVWYNLPTFLML